MAHHAAIVPSTAAAAFFSLHSRAGCSGWTPTRSAGMSAVRAASSAQVRDRSARPTRRSNSSLVSRPCTNACLSRLIPSSRSAFAARRWPRPAAISSPGSAIPAPPARAQSTESLARLSPCGSSRTFCSKYPEARPASARVAAGADQNPHDFASQRRARMPGMVRAVLDDNVALPQRRDHAVFELEAHLAGDDERDVDSVRYMESGGPAGAEIPPAHALGEICGLIRLPRPRGACGAWLHLCRIHPQAGRRREMRAEVPALANSARNAYRAVVVAPYVEQEAAWPALQLFVAHHLRSAVGVEARDHNSTHAGCLSLR